MLAISDLHVAYGQSEVLHGLNVSVQPNEIVAFLPEHLTSPSHSVCPPSFA